jgi:hypothetical protein
LYQNPWGSQFTEVSVEGGINGFFGLEVNPVFG